MREERRGHPPFLHVVPDLEHFLLLVEKENIDRKLHADGVNGFAWSDPQTFAIIQFCVLQQAGAPKFAGVGDAGAVRKDSILRTISNSQLCQMPRNPRLRSDYPIRSAGAIRRSPMTMKRCSWATNDLLIQYHDEEWGVPVHDDRLLFEFLILEGAQAGLSWNTILQKRERYRKVFDKFDPRKVAKYDERKIQELMQDAGIVRNRLKVAAAIQNAKSFLTIQKEFGSFDAYVWRFVDNKPKNNNWPSGSVPARTLESDAMSKDLLRRDFKFVGSTICYAFMQAIGMVNDHAKDCFRRNQV